MLLGSEKNRSLLVTTVIHNNQNVKQKILKIRYHHNVLQFYHKMVT